MFKVSLDDIILYLMPKNKLEKCCDFFHRDPSVCMESYPESEILQEMHYGISETWLFAILFLLGISAYAISRLFKKEKDPKTPLRRKTLLSPNKCLDIEAQTLNTKTSNSPCIREKNSSVRKAIRHGLCNIGNTCYM